jgi:hypothetical protein
MGEHIDTEARGAITFPVTAVAIYALPGGIVRSNMLREKGNSRCRAVLRLPPRHPSPDGRARGSVRAASALMFEQVPETAPRRNPLLPDKSVR